MIVYLANKAAFLNDVFENRIEDRILAEFQTRFRRSVGNAEVQSWKNSMNYMHRVLADDEIPENTGVAIEFNIPQTSKRIDMILTGMDADRRKTAVVVELKQWTEAEPTEKDAVVSTFLGGTVREVSHPSYQAWSYAALLEDFNEAVRTTPILLKPCAYLHNCESGVAIHSNFYAAHTARAPAFLKSDAAKLREFIRRHVKYGDDGDAIYRMRDGRIRPSKNLADSLQSLLKGNREFLMIDDQKIVFENAINLAKKAATGEKQVLIVEGGPGTGKSVVAINLLVALTGKGHVVQYVTKNAAPRAVYESKLTGVMTKSRISNLFTGSGSYTETAHNTFDTLIVDEAHRLNEKSGLYQNKGLNQIKELIESARCTVFFLDEDQRVTFKDIGDRTEIRRWAHHCGAKVHELALASQFRCNGSDGYLAWIDNTLQIRETANPTLEGINYDFRVFDSPRDLREEIVRLNQINNKARIVAGYCWNWESKKNPSRMDIVLPEYNFSARWNLADDGSLWILKPESVSEIGCIHTCQGLELDYVGVILGPDLVIRNGIIETRADERSSGDSSVKGFKKLFRENPELARSRAAAIIKNTYRTLMTRGQKGCFVFSTDPETNAYLRDCVCSDRR